MWRRGRRGQVTIDRPAVGTTGSGWPATLEDGAALTVVDLGLLSPANRGRLARGRNSTVLVCRRTIPGVRLAEQQLAQLVGQPVIVATVGAGRWSGPVVAGTGRLLRDLQAADRVVTVPLHRRLEVTGPTASALPRSVAAAGRALLGLLDAADPGELTTTSAQPAPATKGTRR